MKTILIILLILVVCVAGIIAYGISRWKSGTSELRARIQVSRQPVATTRYDVRETDQLPPPVQRYFRTVLSDGQPIITGVQINHTGEFNMGEAEEKWVPFTSHQVVQTSRPGFDWDARIAMAPGLQAYVHDAYVTGEGILHATLFGLITVAEVRGTPEAAQGELLRYFAEAAWYPTALLPNQGVQWTTIDDSLAQADLTDGDTSVSMTFRFDEEGLISTIRADARYRTVGDAQVATPWEGRFWSYEVHDGMRIPMAGEVAWDLPDRKLYYWRGFISDITYEFAP